MLRTKIHADKHWYSYLAWVCLPHTSEMSRFPRGFISLLTPMTWVSHTEMDDSQIHFFNSEPSDFSLEWTVSWWIYHCHFIWTHSKQNIIFPLKKLIFSLHFWFKIWVPQTYLLIQGCRRCIKDLKFKSALISFFWATPTISSLS